jgi:ribose-phosphate pyrophosphokinase
LVFSSIHGLQFQLASEIATALGTTLGQISVKSYADGEIGIQIQESVRGQDCYIVQPTCPPRVNDALMQLFLLISTFRRAAARTITAVIPYYGTL